MRNSIFGAAAAIMLLSCAPLHAQQDCKAIKDAAARLACFDSPAPAKPPAQVKPAAQVKPPPAKPADA